MRARDLVKQVKTRNQARQLSQEQRKELLEVLAHNDTLGKYNSAQRVSGAKTRSMLSSLGYTVSDKGLDKVCREQLGRKGFTTP